MREVSACARTRTCLSAARPWKPVRLTSQMRHQKTRNKLSRDSAHRKALLMNLSKEIIEHERIETTAAKARAVKPEVERLVTLAKGGDLHARRQALSRLAQDKFAVHKLFSELGPRYADRPGGYTRILKLGPRRSDATEMVFIELV
jgi:large subunit ribosomal protein L17